MEAAIHKAVQQATLSARRAALTAFGAAVLALLMLLDHVVVDSVHEVRLKASLNGLEAVERLLIGRERMRNYAHLASQAGDPSWIAQYEAEYPIVQQGFEAVIKLADPDLADVFKSESLAAQLNIAKIDRTVFEKLRQGDVAGARTALADPDYQYHHDVITLAVDKLTNGIMERSHRDETISKYAIPLSLIPLAIAGALALWQNLNRDLKGSEAAHDEATARLETLSTHDTLTGLSNRTFFLAKLRDELRKAEETGRKFAVVAIDLDRFKPINDLYGQHIGDLVLKEVAARLGHLCCRTDLCARLGGDEFLVVVDLPYNEAPLIAGQRVAGILSEPIKPEGHCLEISARLGIAIYPDNALDAEELLGRAEAALYLAKGECPGSIRWFDDEIHRDMLAREALEAELARAVENNQIVPAYQPQIDLATGMITGVEVLARWVHPSMGPISPDRFIPIAERTDLIDTLLLSTLRTACEDMRHLPNDVTLAINLAPRQFQDERLVHKILSVIDAARFPANRLEVELTESALVIDIDAARRVISEFKRFGVKISLDDFGTGFSSLSYILELHFDSIKIDRTFIMSMRDRRESLTIVAAIVGLAKSLEVPIVAEGVETEADEALLIAMGCSIAQGYYYSKPVPASELPRVVERFSAPRVELGSAA